ncbi:MAG: hypothetical protein ACRDBH_07340, partial [Bosea sp. (in: a-proteobacteria)]
IREASLHEAYTTWRDRRARADALMKQSTVVAQASRDKHCENNAPTPADDERTIMVSKNALRRFVSTASKPSVWGVGLLGVAVPYAVGAGLSLAALVAIALSRLAG